MVPNDKLLDVNPSTSRRINSVRVPRQDSTFRKASLGNGARLHCEKPVYTRSPSSPDASRRKVTCILHREGLDPSKGMRTISRADGATEKGAHLASRCKSPLTGITDHDTHRKILEVRFVKVIKTKPGSDEATTERKGMPSYKAESASELMRESPLPIADAWTMNFSLLLQKIMKAHITPRTL